MLLKESEEVVVADSGETRGLLDEVPVGVDVAEGIHRVTKREMIDEIPRVRYKVTQPGESGVLRLSGDSQ